MKFKKTYSFAFWCSLIISLFSSVLLFSLSKIFNQKLEVLFLLSFPLIIFVFSIIVIQIRVERFIYRRVKQIYDEVSLLNADDLKKATITTNMETLSKEVKKFAEKKQIEITSLNARETYRREFLGNVSHELKTPLFTVQGYLLTLIDGASDNKQIREKYLNRANKGVERLVSIVKDLDLISKLESNEVAINIQQFNIVELIQDVFDLLEIRAKKSGNTLCFNKKYDIPIFVKADEERIEQVLINLVMNSIKYGKKNGITTVSIEPHGIQKILIKITDEGEGIKKEHLGRLFERFYRVDQSRSREQGGSGLGLSIVKHIIEAHDESIFVKSNYGIGSEFSFTLKKV
ncbi:sensor histidine kinase [Urechidicola croceus]|uniref:histidine kinase n=1 Tax=Urechidicola croceus TaxID=1850246 RepID=A0A1D8P9D4_9FLAO|nr:ATP-binding protein [Urechidicola croceus]AOW21179.1 two-component sensor histidine kinase [Urechidicola croceus]